MTGAPQQCLFCYLCIPVHWCYLCHHHWALSMDFVRQQPRCAFQAAPTQESCSCIQDRQGRYQHKLFFWHQQDSFYHWQFCHMHNMQWQESICREFMSRAVLSQDISWDCLLRLCWYYSDLSHHGRWDNNAVSYSWCNLCSGFSFQHPGDSILWEFLRQGRYALSHARQWWHLYYLISITLPFYLGSWKIWALFQPWQEQSSKTFPWNRKQLLCSFLCLGH